MEVVGIITGEIQHRVAPQSQKPYFSFKLVERMGPRGHKSVTWYDCYAHLPESVMAQIKSRDLVRIRGKVEPVAFTRGENEACARLRLVCFHIEVVESYESHLAKKQEAATPEGEEGY